MNKTKIALAILKNKRAREFAFRALKNLMSGNGVLNAFAASTFGYDFVVIHSELFNEKVRKVVTKQVARRLTSK